MNVISLLFKVLTVIVLLPFVLDNAKTQIVKVTSPFVPSLVIPAEGTELDNGCSDRSDLLSWNFDWTEFFGVTNYHLVVWHAGSAEPVVNRDDLTLSEFTHSEYAYVIESNRYDWHWKVRAKSGSVWGPWSEERSFDVEPLNTDCSEPIVYIPDANFKAYLVGRADINTNGDDVIQVSEAEAFSGTINVAFHVILDLTGIEAFVNVAELDCHANFIPSIDLSYNVKLEKLNCSHNNLNELLLNANVSLKELKCHENHIGQLDLSNNKQLVLLNCEYCFLGVLDVSQTTQLQYLNCEGNGLKTLNVSNNLLLKRLECSHNHLTTLNITHNSFLNELDIHDNQITQLGVNNNLQLNSINCSYNLLSSLCFSKIEDLTHVTCNGNKLTVLDVSRLSSLAKISCNDNRLTKLDFSLNTDLSFLSCGNNQLVEIDLSNNPLLDQIHVEQNQLTHLDVSGNAKLYSFSCNDNQLVFLDVRNSNNSHIAHFNASGNTDLSCINVSDVAYASANWIDIDPGVVFSTDCSPVVHIPDANFKACLLANSAINTNGDGEIQVSEAQAYDGTIDVTRQNVKDMTGIEAFTELAKLQCGSNVLPQLDVSANTKLIYLDCSNNRLTHLDVCANQQLTVLKCQQNSLTALDVSCSSALEYLWCYSNALKTINIQGCHSLIGLYAAYNALSLLDVSECNHLHDLSCAHNKLSELTLNPHGDLRYLWCDNNQLTSLDVTLYPKLKELHCYNNALYRLKLGDNPMLYSLLCHDNLLTDLYLEGSKALMELKCPDNLITSLDVSENTQLSTLWCHNNALTQLDVRNGNNSLLTAFKAAGNPDLSCINVSDVGYAQFNWNHIDPDVEFSDNCQAPVVYIPDNELRSCLLTQSEINVNGDNRIQVSEAEAYVGEIVVSNTSVSDLTGIEAFTGIVGLDCSGNGLTQLDISQNTELRYLNCQDNALEELDVTSNTRLQYLFCSSNLLTILDVSVCSQLETLDCQVNQLRGLDMCNNGSLSGLNCSVNALNSLDICNDNNRNITDFNAVQNPPLQTINVSDIDYAIANWTAVDPGVVFNKNCVATRIEGAEGAAFVGVYPNPVSGWVTLEGTAIEGSQIKVFSIQGEVVMRMNNVTGRVIRINLSDLEPAIYFIQLEKEGQVMVYFKVMRQN